MRCPFAAGISNRLAQSSGSVFAISFDAAGFPSLRLNRSVLVVEIRREKFGDFFRLLFEIEQGFRPSSIAASSVITLTSPIEVGLQTRCACDRNFPLLEKVGGNALDKTHRHVP